ncbi:LOW QUALITY PROTEIN: uncharacterized protein LOC143429206 [Xylocopa sonorina]|uniref:LOW QUALITY PROTEIN: uncharacterized protein LOC143429206 n=1 Tax=Xylocopa sonorina TaxID=1818115 RepID=UPI00403B23AE
MLAIAPLQPAKTSGSPSPWSSNEPRASPGTHLSAHAPPGSKMRITCLLLGLSLLVAYAHASPVVKREAESDDLSPLNEVYILEADDDQAADGERSDRDKRKIGIVKLGVSNGIINFVFGKLDSLLDAKTRALNSLEEANKVKNAAYGIDADHSATSKFISDLVAAKIKSASGSIGPVVNSAQTFFANAKGGLTNAFISKLAPLSSIAGGLSGGGLSGGSAAKHDNDGGNLKENNALALLAEPIVRAKSSYSRFSRSHDAAKFLEAQFHCETSTTIGYFSFLSVFRAISTTTEDIPVFDRTRVSLDIPGPAFGTGFTVITNISKILSSVILNSARRTQTVLEVFKPYFRGAFAIKGLASDNHN